MIKPTRSPLEIIQDIDKLTKDAYAVAGDVGEHEAISLILAQLPGLNSGLGSWYAIAQDEARKAETALKAKQAQLFKEYRQPHVKDGKKAPIDDVKVLITLETLEDQKKLDDLTHAKELYRIKREDTRGVVDGLRSRLVDIRDDVRSEQ